MRLHYDAINGLQNVTLMNAALGQVKGNGAVQVRGNGRRSLGGASRITARPMEGMTEAVRILTVDDVVPEDREISIVQLDVEGYEKEALAGARRTIARCTPILVLEKLPEENWLTSNILNLGYKVLQRVNANFVLVHRTGHTVAAAASHNDHFSSNGRSTPNLYATASPESAGHD